MMSTYWTPGACLFACIIVIFFFGLYFLYKAYKNFSDNVTYKEAKGQVSEVLKCGFSSELVGGRASPNFECNINVSFMVDNTPHNFNSSETWIYKVGDVISVIYDVNNPQNARTGMFENQNIYGMIHLFLGLLCLSPFAVFAYYGWKSYHDNAQLIKQTLMP